LIDQLVLATEMRDLMNRTQFEVSEGIGLIPLPISLYGMKPASVNWGIEWANASNWSAGLYFSKKDTRVWVPKSIPWTGSTLNLGTRAGAFSMIGLLIGLPLLMIILMSLVVCR
jgi:hypothetical protein